MTDALAALRARFLDRCAGDRQRLQTLAADGDPATLRALAHSLAGAGGTFGFAEISQAAGRIDDALTAGRAADPDDLQALEAALDQALLTREG